MGLYVHWGLFSQLEKGEWAYERSHVAGKTTPEEYKKKVKDAIPIVLNGEDSLLTKSKKLSSTSKKKKRKKEFISMEDLPEDKNLFAINGQMINVPMAEINTLPVSADPLVSNISSVPIELPSTMEVAGKAIALNNQTAKVAGNIGNTLGKAGAVAGAATGALSGTLGVIGAVKDISTVKDTTEYENSLENIKNETFNAGSTEDFMSQINNKSSVDNISMEALTGTKAENRKTAGKAIGSGASAGAAVGSLFGPIGTAIGGAAGALIGGVASLLGNKKKKKEAEQKQKQLEEQRRSAMLQQSANIGVASDNLQSNMASDIMMNYASEGGPLFKEFSNGVTIINEGGSHEENPHEGIQIGIDPEGIPNMVEEGEVIFNDYVFSDRLIVPKTERKQYKLRGNKETTFADSAKEITKMSEEMPNDPIVKRTMELRLNQLMQEQEIVRETKQNKKNRHSNGGEVNTYKNGEKIKQWYDSNLKGNWDKVGTDLMQAAPVFGSLAATINDWTGGNEADYSNVYKYEDAINKAYKPVSARTLSDYLEYRPYDTSFELNKLAATQAASRRALLNSSAGNSSAARAAILASDYNYSNQIGDTYRRAQEYNDANRRMVADFNRGTNQFNAQAINATNQFNAQQAVNKATALGQVAQWRDQINQANRAEKSANLTGLLEGISGLGQTFYNQGRVKWLQDNNIIVGNDGKLYNKDVLTKNHIPSNEEAAELLKKLNPEELKKLGLIKAANGGKIKRKRRLS